MCNWTCLALKYQGSLERVVTETWTDASPRWESTWSFIFLKALLNEKAILPIESHTGSLGSEGRPTSVHLSDMLITHSVEARNAGGLGCFAPMGAGAGPVQETQANFSASQVTS